MDGCVREGGMTAKGPERLWIQLRVGIIVIITSNWNDNTNSCL